MIKLDESLGLTEIQLTQWPTLSNLMARIYPPVYGHLWQDNGSGYLKKLYSRSRLKAELAEPSSRYYFVEYDNVTIGILRILVDEGITGAENNVMVKLQRIYLASKAQGLGIGRRLVDWVEVNFCQRMGASLWLEVMDSQTAAIRFYQKMGFVVLEKFIFPGPTMKEKYRGMYRMVKNCRQASLIAE